MRHLPLTALLLTTLGTPVCGQDATAIALPESAFRTKLATLQQAKAAAPAKATAELLRPELSFKPRRRWLLLPELAKQLGNDDAEQTAARLLLEASAVEVRTALAAEGAEHDLGAAAALFVSQLWQVARQQAIPEAHVDALHAQVVATLAGPELGEMTDPLKQRCWEFCVAYPMFLAGMLEAVADEPRRAGLRALAGQAFESALGVPPERVEFDARGLTVRAPRSPRKPPTPNAARAPGATSLPATAPAIAAVTYTPPTGWTRTADRGTVIFRATLTDVDDQGHPEADDSSSHQATIGFLPVLTATQGPTALFDQVWREQFGAFELGDTFVHYRARTPSQLVVLYMGRFFARPDAPRTEGTPKTYGALYLIDLGNDRFQPLVAVVEPRDPGLGMDMFKESAAMQALGFPLGAVIDSLRPAKGTPPYPAGGFFAAADLRGRWSESGSAFGGTYYNSATGSFAGAAVLTSGGHFTLADDGTYDYAFAYASSHPQFGNSGGSTSHSGKYRLNGDIVLVEPNKPLNYQFTCCAVGIGSRHTAQGTQRVLITVSAHSDGGFRAPHLIPNWDRYPGVMTWYTEQPR
jgi:hypothetical protein